MNQLVRVDHLYVTDSKDNIENTTKRLWANVCIGVRNKVRTNTNLDFVDSTERVPLHDPYGYALKKRKKVTRISQKLKHFVRNVFDELSGKKANPYTVSKTSDMWLMRREKDYFTLLNGLVPSKLEGCSHIFQLRKLNPSQMRGRLRS